MVSFTRLSAFEITTREGVKLYKCAKILIRKPLIFIFLLLLTSVWVYAQALVSCSTDKLSQKNLRSELALNLYSREQNVNEIMFWQRRLEESLNSGEVVISIPIVVHVIHNDLASSPNPFRSSRISEIQVFSQIRVLNEDFRKKRNTNGENINPLAADVGIEFCLASTDPFGLPTSGINYVYNPRKMWNTDPDQEEELKSLSYWPSDKYLNIWVTNLEVEKGFGYARYPHGTDLDDLDPVDYGEKLDGVVIDHRVFGTLGTSVYPYNLGRTTTHEIGHWLGLRHIWGDEICGNDFVDDTPPDEGPNNDKDCADSSFCADDVIQDMTNNYLDFSPDRCMNLFTIGQKTRMLRSLVTSPRRRGLFQSDGCSGLNQKLYVNTYPNPSSDEVYIELFWPGHQAVQMECFNNQGKMIVSYRIETLNAQTFPLNTSAWPQGIYFLKVRPADNNDRAAVKMVKILVQH